MTLSIASIGSFFIGGKTVSVAGLPALPMKVTHDSPIINVEQNGEFAAFQMYVQYVKLVQRRAKYPLLLWHGGSLTGAMWEHTPDERPGWQTAFLQAGHDVYVSDAVERGRSSWARFPEIYPSPPIFRARRETWDLFRIGPELGTPFEGVQFPCDAFDNFMKSIVPRWVCTDEPALEAYAALLDRIGSALVVAHSQGAGFALEMAHRRPSAVKALIALEPSARPHPAPEVNTRVRDIPHLFVWGDYVSPHFFWGPLRTASLAYHDELLAAGCDSTFIDLPERGIRGNSHMLMHDRNTDAILELISRWLAERKLAP